MELKNYLNVASLAFAAALGSTSLGHASAVDLTYDLDLNGMSSGSCPGGVCGTVTVVGDTTSSLAFTIDLATDVNFHGNHTGSSGTGPVFYFDLTNGGQPITFSGIGDSGTIGGKNYSYNSPLSGSFAPNSGNFPGTYDYEVTCTNNTSGKICGSPLTFTASGADLMIGAPFGHGLFSTDTIAFVADLAVTHDGRTSTGLVGASLIMPPGVPEPSTWAMMALGFVGLSFAGYRKARSAISII